MKKIFYTAKANYKRWVYSPQIYLAFMIGFIFCFLLSDKVVQFSKEHDTVLQMNEAFIWTFGDAKSVMVVSLMLLLIFADMPHLGNDVPFFLVRIDRRTYILGQIFYMVSATAIYALFIMVSTMLLSMSRSYSANMWSDTAAILGYSNIGQKIAVPTFVKVLERSYPYQVSLNIFALLLGYTMLLSSIILFLNLVKDNLGMVGGIIYCLFGYLLTPDIVQAWFKLSDEQSRIANIIFGWMSPLNQATYYMHNFGYDNLPRLGFSYGFFAVTSTLFFVLSAIKIKRYTFNFTGTWK